MKIGLRSDFNDYYDHCFTTPWEVADKLVERLTTVGMPNATTLLYLDSIDLVTPTHGRVQELVPVVVERSGMPAAIAEKLFELVVYTDEYGATDSNKLRLNCLEAVARYPEAYASVFIPSSPETGGSSLRYLRLGMRAFWLRYTSKDDWRSHHGSMQIELLGEESRASEPHAIPYPLFAIDFVKSDRLYAVGLDIAPRLQGTGIEHLITADEVYQELCAARLGSGK
jgi:hypothetical protein